MSGLFYTLLMFVGPLLAAGLITVLVLAGGWSRSKD